MKQLTPEEVAERIREKRGSHDIANTKSKRGTIGNWSKKR